MLSWLRWLGRCTGWSARCSAPAPSRSWHPAQSNQWHEKLTCPFECFYGVFIIQSRLYSPFDGFVKRRPRIIIEACLRLTLLTSILLRIDFVCSSSKRVAARARAFCGAAPHIPERSGAHPRPSRTDVRPVQHAAQQGLGGAHRARAPDTGALPRGAGGGQAAPAQQAAPTAAAGPDGGKPGSKLQDGGAQQGGHPLVIPPRQLGFGASVVCAVSSGAAHSRCGVGGPIQAVQAERRHTLGCERRDPHARGQRGAAPDDRHDHHGLHHGGDWTEGCLFQLTGCLPICPAPLAHLHTVHTCTQYTRNPRSPPRLLQVLVSRLQHLEEQLQAEQARRRELEARLRSAAANGGGGAAGTR